MKHSKVFLTSLLALTAITLIRQAQMAQADAYAIGPPEGGYEPDDKLQDWCWTTPGGSRAMMTNHLAYLRSNTNQRTRENASCTNWTDMVMATWNDPGDTTRGVYWCDTWNGEGECDRAHVEVNLGAPSITNSLQERKTWCHEVGHSLGLSHRGDTDNCMMSGSSEQIVYDPNHINHINNDIN